MRVRPNTRGLAVLLLVTIVAGSLGCSHAGSSAESGQVDRHPDEISCEMGLLRLERLIEERAADGDVMQSVIVEAREIYEMSRELYLQREYILALDLIEEGIQLFEN